MEQANEVTIETILAEDEGKLSKKKEEIVEDYVAENDGYLESFNEIQGHLESLVEKAEEIIAGAAREPVSSQARQTSDPAAQAAVPPAVQTTNNNDFRPHSNLKPSFLEKGSSHLEVKNFCEQIQAYIIEALHHRAPRACGSTSRLVCTRRGTLRWSRTVPSMRAWRRSLR